MTRDYGRRPRPTIARAIAGMLGKSKRNHARKPAVESLEGRQLLAQFYSGPTPTRPVQSAGGVYTLTMTGPGFETVHQLGHGLISINLLGTTAASSFNVTLTRPRPHKRAVDLQVGAINVATGVIGSINASPVNLVGPVTPLNGVSSIAFGSLGGNAQIDVNGSLQNLNLGSVALGPNGHVNITGDLGQSLSVGSLSAVGGSFRIGHDLAGSLNVGNVSLAQGGSFIVGHDVTGGAAVTGDLTLASGGLFGVGHNLDGLSIAQSATLDTGGQIAVGGDLAGSLSVAEGLTLDNGSKLTVARDLTGTLSVAGDLSLSNGSQIAVGRDLNALQVNGNLRVNQPGAGILVGGNLPTLTVGGAFVGNGTPAPDLSVGLNLGSLNVLGGGANQGGLQNASIDVGKNLLGLNVTHGIFNSLITAGVLIDGGNSGSNVGADGVDAVLNSDIRAGVEIRNLTIAGDVRSTFATNPTTSKGYRTRIVAGETRAGGYLSGGLIDNFQITGQLIDSVLAASVAPYGGDGTLPATGYGASSNVGPAPGDGGSSTYDAPAGTITGGTVANPVKYPNYSELSYYNERLTGVTYNTDPKVDPTIDDTILAGAINPSFASAPLGAAGLIAPDAVLPLPTKSTVLGGVVSTAHGDEADFAGIFAADTRGVFIGSPPTGTA